jgi:hypothetical protein
LRKEKLANEEYKEHNKGGFPVSNSLLYETIIQESLTLASTVVIKRIKKQEATKFMAFKGLKKSLFSVV